MHIFNSLEHEIMNYDATFPLPISIHVRSWRLTKTGIFTFFKRRTNTYLQTMTYLTKYDGTHS